MEAEEWASHATADVIFRTLFSIPISEDIAQETYAAFRTFQRAQPVGTIGALLPWVPFRASGAARESAARLRNLVRELVARKQAEIAGGGAGDDLAAKIMGTPDPETGETFSEAEMVDQVAIFFLAGHETSAALLGWALWCLAAAPEWGEKVAEEARGFHGSP